MQKRVCAVLVIFCLLGLMTDVLCAADRWAYLLRLVGFRPLPLARISYTELQQRAARIQDDTSLTDDGKVAALAQLYLDYRIEQLPSELQGRARQLLADVTLTDGFSGFDRQTGKVFLARSMNAHPALRAIVLAHELEHFSSFPDTLGPVRRRPLNLERAFSLWSLQSVRMLNAEQRAIGAEWDMLNLLTPAQVASARTRFAEAKDISEEEKQGKLSRLDFFGKRTRRLHP